MVSAETQVGLLRRLGSHSPGQLFSLSLAEAGALPFRELVAISILRVQAAQWAVLHLISIHHRWQDSTAHVGCNNSCSLAFQNLMAEPAVSYEWMLNSDCFISDRQLWTLGCSSRSGKIRAKMRRLWNWFEGLVHFRLIFNRMQIKDLAFSDKCLIDHKLPLNYQLQDKRVLKTSLFSEGWLYHCISVSVMV